MDKTRNRMDIFAFFDLPSDGSRMQERGRTGSRMQERVCTGSRRQEDIRPYTRLRTAFLYGS